MPGVTSTVRVVPAHTVASVGFFTIAGAAGWSTTVQLTLLLDEVVQPVPVEVLRDSIIFVPVTAAKLGTVVLHEEKLVPPSVE